MRYTELGKSNLKPSVIGQGSGQFGTTAWGYNSRFNSQDVFKTVRREMELGINLFDTAETYGNGVAEVLLGQALSGYRRDEYIVVSKVAPWNAGYDDVIKAADRSLKRLNTNVIDLYLVHYPNPLVPMKHTFRALETLVRRGKVRFIGTSNFSPFQLKRAQEALAHEEITANEIEYNILSRRSEQRTIPYCRDLRIGVIAYSPLAGGILTGRFTADNAPRDRARAFNFLAQKSFLQNTYPLFQTLKEIADSRTMTISQVALSWIISQDVAIPIPAALESL